MQCELCDYLVWRLKDVRISRDKAIEDNLKRQLHGCNTKPLEGAYDDYNHVVQALRLDTKQHPEQAA
jgi:hypothetical protein